MHHHEERLLERIMNLMSWMARLELLLDQELLNRDLRKQHRLITQCS